MQAADKLTPDNRVVLDTNCLLVSISKYGVAYPVWKGFQEGRYTLCVTTEIPFPKLLVLKLKTFIEKLTASKE